MIAGGGVYVVVLIEDLSLDWNNSRNTLYFNSHSDFILIVHDMHLWLYIFSPNSINFN